MTQERPRTSGFLSDGVVPGHWTQVLAGMRTNALTYLTLDEVRAEASHLLILAPSPEVAQVLSSESCSAEFADGADVPTAEVIEARATSSPDRVPARTWVFLPHRQDGSTELEETSTRRCATTWSRRTLHAGPRTSSSSMEYGINLWMWTEPPSSGGDPVCLDAGELISWESAWALDGSSVTTGFGVEGAGARDDISDAPAAAGASARPPIYFGLPSLLRRRRWANCNPLRVAERRVARPPASPAVGQLNPLPRAADH